jgi:hypothetical protein
MRRKRERGWGGKRAGSGRPSKPKPAIAPPTAPPDVGDDYDAAAVLRAISLDSRAPFTARVNAARALLPRSEPQDAERDRERSDEITRRALTIMRNARPN